MGDTGVTLVGLGLPICTEQLFPKGLEKARSAIQNYLG